MKRFNQFSTMLFGLFAFAAVMTSCNKDCDCTEDPTCETCPPVDTTAALEAEFANYFATAGNEAIASGVTRTNLVPSAGTQSLSVPTNAFFDGNADYNGAVAPTGAAWYEGWSFYSEIAKGNTTDIARTVPAATKTITDNGSGTGTVTWSKDTVYILDGFVFVNAGQVLTIEAGTVIKGKAGQQESAAALVVARGGQIQAVGTASEPIIFTFEADNLDGTTSASTSGQWGGLIILGDAVLNSAQGVTQIEGIPTTETRGEYGGSNNADNSGTLQYVSIRHGGTDIGAGNEINGLTLGGVGSATTIDYVEIVGNKDDGIEFFGGVARTKHLIVTFCQDDAVDYDEGYDGLNQFVIVHQDATADQADRGGEHDGGTDPEDGTPYATPEFYNVTSIGNSGSRALTFRDNAGGEYHNSVFVDYGRGIDIEYLLDANQDSWKQFKDGNLKLQNNIFDNIAAGNTAADLFKVSVN